MRLFHAGVGVELPFWPLSHFGTRQAALDRLQHTIKSEHDLQAMCLIEVSIPDEGLKFIDCDDFGAPKPEAILGVILGDDREARYLISRRIQEEVEESDMTKAEKKIAARRIAAEAVASSCYALRYRNEYEDVGAVSYCILNPDVTDVVEHPVRQISSRSAAIDLGDAEAIITLLDQPETGIRGKVDRYAGVTVRHGETASA